MSVSRMLKAPVRVSILCAGVVVLVACSDPGRAERAEQAETADAESSDDGAEESSGTSAGPAEVDEQVIMDQAMAYKTTLQQLTTELEQSETHSDAASVHVWGSAAAAESFFSVNPDDPTQIIDFEEGTMFVKEHFDGTGAVVGLTVMYKGPEGYFPEARDWYWARVRGEAVVDSGRVEFCSECHEAAYNTDFVVGFNKGG